MKAPMPFFGSKSMIAPAVWRRFGDVQNYVEPFAGSLAVLLARPTEPGIETVNDVDGFIANFWRSLQRAPDAVAEFADWPVNEVDLEARHKWLCQRERKAEFLARMKDDPDFYNAKFAGWWVWGLCSWIGRGWCNGEWVAPGMENRGPGINVRDPEHGGKRPHLGPGRGVYRQLPHLGPGRGVHRQLPHLGPGRGVHRQRPHLGAGMGVHRANAGGSCAERRAWLLDYMRALADRLRRVRVCCGDWSRIMGPSPTFKLGLAGVFLDPPYSAEAGRDNDIYRMDCGRVAHEVRSWCIENGSNPLLRIALCGYEGEGHRELESLGWTVMKWKAHGGMGLQGTKKSGLEYVNKYRERIWFSPACIREPSLFEDAPPENIEETDDETIDDPVAAAV